MSGNVSKVLVLAAVLAVAGCASEARPVLYPNDHLSAVGQAQADADLAECRRMAETAGASGGEGRGEGAARGTAVGAATGATAGLMRSLFRRSGPSHAYRGFVDRCLRERGYDPVGWE